MVLAAMCMVMMMELSASTQRVATRAESACRLSTRPAASPGLRKRRSKRRPCFLVGWYCTNVMLLNDTAVPAAPPLLSPLPPPLQGRLSSARCVGRSSNSRRCHVCDCQGMRRGRGEAALRCAAAGAHSQPVPRRNTPLTFVPACPRGTERHQTWSAAECTRWLTSARLLRGEAPPRAGSRSCAAWTRAAAGAARAG